MRKKNVLRDNILLGIGFALMIAALYMIFVYVPTEESMGVVQRIFYFHVPIAWVAFLAFFIVFLCSIAYLWKRNPKWDIIARSSAEVGIVFTTLVLVTGAIWAKSIWGVWWTWDARLTSSLVLWLIYISYLLVRSYTTEESRGARFAAVVGIVGFINVPIVALAVNLWRTQHPTTLIFEGGLTSSMLITLLVSIAAFTVLYVALTLQNISLRSLESEIKQVKHSKNEQGEE
jgi:heme exporter protein C